MIITVNSNLSALSNVDITEEIPQMVSAQRGYEVNIKMIKSQEETLDSVLNVIG